ncbi:MAG: helix-turn-helix domain-containing protein [Actinobacteria bacterium]|nr:helix-turn-helix domain-containing protein [Actinomycetota bacterium]
MAVDLDPNHRIPAVFTELELGQRVRELRVQQGLSQTELARRAGMTQPAVARFEAGGTVPTLPVLERLARSLGAELTVQLAPCSSVA